jgi:magnesium transporter
MKTHMEGALDQRSDSSAPHDLEHPEPVAPADDAGGSRIAEREEPLPDTISDALDTEGPADDTAGARTGRVTAWLFQEGAEPKQIDPDEVAELASDEAVFVWVDLDGYEPDDLEGVARRLDLPEAGVRLAVAGWQRPRLSVFGSLYVATVTVPHEQEDGQRVLASELDLFVGRNYLVSAHKEPLPFAGQALTRAAQNPSLLALDSAFLLSIFIDELLAHYEQLTERLEDEIETLEERALTDASDEFLEDLLHFKRVVFATHRLAAQHRPLLEAFLRPDFPLVGGEAIEPYLRDLEERLDRVLDALGAARDGVNGTFDLYVSRVAHQTNSIVTVLTVVSATLLPASVVLGFFGTSFQDPGIATPTGFLVMVLLLVITTGGSLWLFYRWGWLGGQRKRSRR